LVDNDNPEPCQPLEGWQGFGNKVSNRRALTVLIAAAAGTIMLPIVVRPIVITIAPTIVTTILASAWFWPLSSRA